MSYVFFTEFESSLKDEARNNESRANQETKLENSENEKLLKTSRPWTPLELVNPAYENLLKTRENTIKQRNFLTENIVSGLMVMQGWG